MTTEDDVIAEVREELAHLRELRKGHQRRRWYEREPATTVFAHASTLVLAVGIGFFLHKCTGEPIVIEAKNAPAPSPDVAMTAPLLAAPPPPALADEQIAVILTGSDGGTTTLTGAIAAQPSAPPKPKKLKASAPPAPAAAAPVATPPTAVDSF